MVTKTIAIYVFLDDIFKSISHKEPINRKASDSEIATTLLIAAQYFGGNIEKAISFVRGTGLMPTMLSTSRFNRRMHRMGEFLSDLFFQMGHVMKELTISDTYIIDSFPVALCHNIRISHSRIAQGAAYRGYCASKRSWFYGYKVHMVVTREGIPVEYTFTHGSSHDMQGLRGMPLNLSEGSTLYADAAYTDYTTEEMRADDGIRLLAARTANSKRPHEPWVEYFISISRKRIEVAFSDIAKYMPKTIHAVTQNGFLIKPIAFIWGYTLDRILKL
ncbi:hypothetical protein EZS27_011690 [termite gut metagenome]|uniref:Transposase DDE domain-containing protein n=1 Tax=termite gut metagenome TaxID=433724 RepID=A0A5J4S3Y8_9ZZZZ